MCARLKFTLRRVDSFELLYVLLEITVTRDYRQLPANEEDDSSSPFFSRFAARVERVRLSETVSTFRERRRRKEKKKKKVKRN